jgi:hypothetical protein
LQSWEVMFVMCVLLWLLQDSGLHLVAVDESNEHCISVWDLSKDKPHKLTETKVLGVDFISTSTIRRRPRYKDLILFQRQRPETKVLGLYGHFNDQCTLCPSLPYSSHMHWPLYIWTCKSPVPWVFLGWICPQY